MGRLTWVGFVGAGIGLILVFLGLSLFWPLAILGFLIVLLANFGARKRDPAPPPIPAAPMPAMATTQPMAPPAGFAIAAVSRGPRWPWLAATTLGVLLAFALGTTLNRASGGGDATAERPTGSLAQQLALKTAEVEQLESTLEHVNGELQSLLDANATLTSQVEILKLKEDACEGIDSAQDRADSCEQRLATATSRLEELQAAQRSQRTTETLLAMSTSAPPPPMTRKRPARNEPKDQYVFVRDPRVTVIGDGSVAVVGTLHNANRQPIEGFLVVDLIVDGREYASETLHLTLDGNVVESYDVRFQSVISMQHRYRARAEWGKER